MQHPGQSSWLCRRPPHDTHAETVRMQGHEILKMVLPCEQSRACCGAHAQALHGNAAMHICFSSALLACSCWQRMQQITCLSDVSMLTFCKALLQCSGTAPEAFVGALSEAAALSAFSDASVSSSPDLSASINFFLQREPQRRLLMLDNHSLHVGCFPHAHGYNGEYHACGEQVVMQPMCRHLTSPSKVAKGGHSPQQFPLFRA